MKNRIVSLIVLSFLMGWSSLSAQWSPVGDKIKTEWALKVDPENVLPEYPRPVMERGDWKNLNGLWEYAITKAGSAKPSAFEGQILVPFPVESSLSGVGKRVGDQNALWYKRSFTVPSSWKGKKILLNFGAVDWKSEVWVNGVKLGTHTGGYTPFSFDMTPAINKKGVNELIVKVWDPTDAGPQPRGKQVNRPEGIWYTPVTGIWQTVWMEPVSEHAVKNLRVTPDLDRNRFTVSVEQESSCPEDIVKVELYEGARLVASEKSIASRNLDIAMPEDVKLWSPSSPFLYALKVSVWNDGKKVDEVKSYAAMRKYSTRRDGSGIVRLQLNNKDIFHYGPLDQGWWPDGLYTAPTDEALKYDIQKTKDLGFNMIRKHIKVEPARWYTYCDQMGMIVWQDMPSGDRGPEWQNFNYFNGTEYRRSAESEAIYRKEWKEIIDALYSYPCIGVWVPFNEAWGQFKTVEIADWTKQYDPTRLVNPASGGNHYPCGDMLDLHNYPNPILRMYDAQRSTVLGEFGGIGLAMKEHLWEPDRNWGYVQFNSSKEATDEYVKYGEILLDLVPKGYSAAVYTQTTDVEVEVNGLITYDRKIVKMDENRVNEINQRLCNSLNK